MDIRQFVASKIWGPPKISLDNAIEIASNHLHKLNVSSIYIENLECSSRLKTWRITAPFIMGKPLIIIVSKYSGKVIYSSWNSD